MTKPYYRRRNTYRKRRKIRKARAARRKGVVKYRAWPRNSMPTIAPPKALVKCTYQVVGLSTGSVAAGGSYNQFFSGNSLFDPDYSGIGIMATNMANNSAARTFGTFYTKYRVVGCKASCTFSTFTDSGANSVIPVVVGFFPVYDDDNSPGTPPTISWPAVSYSNACGLIGNQPYGHPKLLYCGTTAQNTGKNFKHYRARYFSSRSIIGPKLDPNSTWGATLSNATVAGSSPTQQWFFCCTVLNPSAAAQTCYINAKFEYYTEFFDRLPTMNTQA